MDEIQANQVVAGNLFAGEALDPVAPCYIKGADGLVYMCNGTNADEAARFIGFTPRAYTLGEPVTLFGFGSRFKYGASLTAGDVFYIAGTKGRLDTAATTGDSMGVATVINSTDILVTRVSTISLQAVADGNLTGAKVANVADSNAAGGIRLIHRFDISAGANADKDIVLTHKERVIDARLVLQGAGVASSVCTVKNGANAITDTMAASGADKAVVRAASLDDAQWDIAAGGTLRVTFSAGATQPAATVFVETIRVA
jgi:hypothetical protein